MIKSNKIKNCSIILTSVVLVVLSVVLISACNVLAGSNTLKAKTLKIGLEKNCFPYSFENSDGEIVGFYKNYCDKLCEDIGYKAEYELLPVDMIVDSVEEHKVDIAFISDSVTDELSKRVNFTEPYVQTNCYLYINNDKTIDNLIEESKQHEIWVLVKSKSYDFERNQIESLLNNRVAFFNQDNDSICWERFVNDKAFDGFITKDYNLQKPINELNINKYQLHNGQKHDLAIAINKEIKNIDNKLNAAIKIEQENGYFDKLYEAIINSSYDPNWNGSLS